MAIETSNPDLKRYLDLVKSVGKLGAHTLFPNDFEHYMVSFELVKIDNDKEKVVDFFTFPIMPKSISETYPSLDKIKKTVGGITILSTNTFVPVDIELSGNFGKRFKFLAGRNLVDFSAISFSTEAGKYTSQSVKAGLKGIKPLVFNSQIKTGYGCIKILQAIIDKSKSISDTGSPYKLYFYNTASGNSFQVKKVVLSKKQSMEENTIWNYSISMKGIEPLDNIKGKILKYGTMQVIEKGVKITSDILKTELRSAISSNIKEKTKII